VILFAPEAVQDFKRLLARERSTVKEAIEKHLRYEPQKISKSRIKRLQGISRPQYRLAVDEIRVFYDVAETTVEVLAIIPKSKAQLHVSHLVLSLFTGANRVSISQV
jgi:mRNA-degrading endonuclease RelE of RelBE toxin-antitoxin system